MRALILHPRHNAPGKRDVTGAFRPEVFAFAKYLQAEHGAAVYVKDFDNTDTKRTRRAEVERAVWETGPDGVWDVVAFFCHGFTRGLQTGHDLATVDDLAECIALRSSASVVVPLYACSTASTRTGAPGGDGGFADALRDALSRRGKCGHVDAHDTVAHTTKNPRVRRFYADGEAEGTGGDWLVAPGSPKWRAWRKALKGDMRFRFPFMTPAEIDQVL